MRSRHPLHWSMLVLAALVARCSAGDSGNGSVFADGGNPTGIDAGACRGSGCPDGGNATGDTSVGPTTCTDTDGDGLSDLVEGRYFTPPMDTDGDGVPDYLDTDSDNDNFLDAIEARRAYPMYTMHENTLVCGGSGNDCDLDGIPNHRDLDSDNDGLTDQEELLYHTDPCNPDTDGDGVSDLIEVAAGSNPLDPTSRPPASDLFVVLPYYPPSMPGAHEHRQFTFQTRIRQADVFFLVDNSASMQSLINALTSNFSSMIVPGIQAAIPDIRMGVGSFDSMPNGADGDPGTPGDYTLWIRQGLTTDMSAAQRAFGVMHTIDTDTGSNFFGGDEPECQTEAAYEVIAGSGSHGHESDAAARMSAHNALDPRGNGWVPTVNAISDCGQMGTDVKYGWGCFLQGRVPIVVLASDAHWYDGCSPGSPSSSTGHNCNDLAAALNTRGGYFVGIDVGMGVNGYTYNNAQIIATMTHTLDASGHPIVFGPGRNFTALAGQVVMAITQIAGQSRQDITTHTVPDPMPVPAVVMGHTTADFIKAVTPVRGIPDAPAGYDHHDTTTFYSVLPTTQVVFDVDFYNDFQPGTATAQLFHATINVIGRGGTVVDTRPVFIVVPAQNSGFVPM